MLFAMMKQSDITLMKAEIIEKIAKDTQEEEEEKNKLN
jgi:hypothetical protein